MLKLIPYFSILLLISCNPGNLEHERYIKNNTDSDTIIVYNPDFPDKIDTILPGNLGLFYQFEILDTDQQAEKCAFPGDTLIVKNQLGHYLKRSVKEESYWTYTVQGEKQRLQQCTFVINAEDFVE